MSKPTPPDGSDPRVLTVSDDAPDVLIARANSSAKAYHTNECATVEQMNNPKTVSKPVAEWNDHEKCARCIRIDSGEDYKRPGAGPVRIDTGYHNVSALRCLAIRAFALRGKTHAEIAETVGVTKSTVTRHIAGKCTCDHHGHTVTYDEAGDAHPTGDSGVPINPRDGNIALPATTCARVRRLLTDTSLTPQPLADLLGASHTTVRKHATNASQCTHDHSDTHPPVEYDHEAQTWRQRHE